MDDFKKFTIFILCWTSLIVLSQQVSLPTDPTYNAGVVEHSEAEGTPRERLRSTLTSYMNILSSNESADLDILVFPEYVLNSKEMATFVPDPSKKISPCISPDYDIFLVELSCAIRSRGIYVLVNLVEKELCGQGFGSPTLNGCPPDGVQYFNTNVVFDRQGRVISRYRKTHLWRYEYYSRSVLVQPDLATFETDFGVTFGHIICFDMLFYEPVIRLVRELNITDILYPTYWFSELPFLTALQLQEGWAFANNVNLLAADGSRPAGKTTGSGIYAGRLGRLTAAIYEEPTVQLLKARVPKRNMPVELPAEVLPVFQPQLRTPRYTELALFRDYNVDIFTTELLAENFTSVQRQLCHGNTFCCDFDVQRSAIGGSVGDAAYRYRLAAYLGNETTFIRVDRSAQAVCALVSCTTEELSSCGRIFPKATEVFNKYYFRSISVSAKFPKAPRRLIMPSTVDGVMLPLPVAQYNWTERPLVNETLVSLQLLSSKTDLLTFGIWANYYTEIPTIHNLNHLQGAVCGTTSGAEKALFSSLLWVLASACCLLSR